MSNALLGFDSAAIEQPIRYTFDKNRGYTTIRTFTGTEAQIQAKELFYSQNGWSTDVTEGPIWKLQATWGADDRQGAGSETPVDTWELFANVCEKDILSGEDAVVRALTNAKLNYLRDVLDGKVAVAGLDCSTQAKTPTVLYGDANAVALFKLICSGVKQRRINVPTLRHTKTASRDYEFSSAVSGVDEIYSTAVMGNLNDIPNWIYNNMPPAPATNPWQRTDGIYVFSGWNKHYPQIQVTAYGKSQICTEWEYNNWAALIYPYH